MFGYVTANIKELTKEQRLRYNAVYCGICRRIRSNASQGARLGLSYDMAFLSLLLMSLYEPEEESGKNPCLMHPVKRRPWFRVPMDCCLVPCAELWMFVSAAWAMLRPNGCRASPSI